MSPGATFERVYNELKRMLVEGELPPGRPIEPALIGRQIGASITPVRDALHRLTGERLVEAPNHNGFRVMLPTEMALRDLYSWNGIVLGSVVRQISSETSLNRPFIPDAGVDIVSSTSALFLKIASVSRNAELTNAIGSINDRLAAFRRAETVALRSVAEELTSLANDASSGDRSALARALKRYHRRRIGAVAAIIASLGSARRSWSSPETE